MRQSKHLGKTLKEDPKDAQTAAHTLMLRAGYIKQVSPGVYTYMPFLVRTFHKISQIIREEMNAEGCEELLMPVLQPKELWVESDRWECYAGVGGIMFTLKDRRGSTVCLGPAHEEVVTDLVRTEVTSYKQLPKRLYQVQTRFRDEIRPRFGLMRAREFMVKDAYSFDIDEAGLNVSYQAMHDAYHRICTRIGVQYRCAEADAGAIGGMDRHAFMVLADTGEDTILCCGACDYAAIQERAESRLKVYPQDNKEKPMEAVYGPGLIGVEPLAKFLDIPVWKTTKTLLFQADDRVVAVMVRGDCDVNEVKVKHFLRCNELTLASPELIKELTGAEVGYAGPINLPPEITVIADHHTRNRVNFECGANQTDYHYINVNFGRDIPLPSFGDFKLAKPGDLCPHCDKGTLSGAHGTEAGYTAKLGTRYSKTLNCTYLDREGKAHAMAMGSYCMGVSRMAAAIIEQSHDDNGVIWPISIAPFQVHLIALNLEDEEVAHEAEGLYRRLLEQGIDVLFDDRTLRAGEKFRDADLLGMPIRVTISRRTSKEQKIELKFRHKEEGELFTYEEALRTIKDACG
jgi:prolyl-tRNA synthetase